MEFGDFLQKIPPVTKYYMGSVLLLAVTASLRIISPYWFVLVFENAVLKLQIWRFITSYVFAGTFGFPFLMRLAFSYFGFSKLERLYMQNRMADFFWQLFTVALLNLGISAIFSEHLLLSRQFAFSLLYIWCKKEPFEKAKFILGFVVKSAYLPWAIIIYTVLTGEGVYKELIGAAVGHAFIFIKDVLPNDQNYRIDLFRTPKFVEKLVDKYWPKAPTNNFGGANNQDLQANQGQRIFGGRGVRVE